MTLIDGIKILATMGNTLQTPQPPPPQESTHGDEEHHRINNSKEQERTESSEEEEFYDVEEEHYDDDDGDDDGGQVFTCEICIEPTKKSTRAITRCTHQYCVDCMIKYIKVKIEDDNEPHVKCPAPNCTHSLDPVACAPIVGPAIFVRWCDGLCRSSLSGVDTCYCPYAGCSELLFSDCKNTNSNTKTNKKSECPMCKRWFCFACKKAWHAGFGCDDVPTDRADVAFGRLAERMTWMRCPNCRHFVERRGGCRVVKCRCGIRFCYKCGKKVEGWCNCDSSYNFEHCCSWCIRFFIFLALLMLPWLSLLHKQHNHQTHK